MRTTIVLFGAVAVFLAAGAQAAKPEGKQRMYDELSKYIAQREAEFEQIPASRQEELKAMAQRVAALRKKDEAVSLTFICTHNSRRSHLSQIWARVAAEHHGIAPVHTYSGGTEATAFNPRAVSALERAGFRISKTTDDDNPIYHVRYSDKSHPLTCFSKVYDQAPNPQDEFIAVMTCSDADRRCPVVSGAAARIAIAYEDPKVADNTPAEQARYDERCAQIAREMLYAFGQVRSAMH